MTTKRTVGAVTGTSTAGATAGAAIAQIITWAWPQTAEIEAAITVLLTLALGILAGWAVPPKDDEETNVVLDHVPTRSVDFARHEHE